MKLILSAISKNNASYINHFELLEQLQLWKEVETDEGNETKTDERPSKSATYFYRTLTDAQKATNKETVKALRTHYTEKAAVVFRGLLARKCNTTEKHQKNIGKLCNAWLLKPTRES